MPQDAPEIPVLDLAREAGALLQAHADTVARFGVGIAPSFKQELNRVLAREAQDGCDPQSRPVEGMKEGRKGL